MAKIVFLDEYSLAGGNLLPIKELGDYTGYYNTTPESVVEHCHGAEIVISNKVVLSEEVIAQLPDLRLIAVAATGMNNDHLGCRGNPRIGTCPAAKCSLLRPLLQEWRLCPYGYRFPLRTLDFATSR